jgi:hypothetical protein
MPKRKRPELSPKEQIKRFKELAKEAEVTQDEAEIERSFKRIARAKVLKKKK